MKALWANLLNLRAVLEPYNYTRRILGIEVAEDSKSDYYHQDAEHFTDDKFGYFMRSDQHIRTLDQIIAFHEEENVMSNIPKAEVFYGKTLEDAAQQFMRTPSDTPLSLVYMDRVLSGDLVSFYKSLSGRFVPGTIICPCTTNAYYPSGELSALLEVLGNSPFTLSKSKFIPEKVYVKLT